MNNLLNAIRTGNINMVEMMLNQNPAAINQADPRGFTPLIFATYMGNLALAKLLLHKGANLNAQDAAGNTALMGVAFKGDKDIAELLIQSGAALNVQNKNGETALIYAANYGQAAIPVGKASQNPYQYLQKN